MPKKTIKGFGGGGGKNGGGGGGRIAQEAPDSLRSTAFASVLDLVSEGEIFGLANGLKSVYFNDTPLENADGSKNFSGVTIVSTNGTQSQSFLSGFSAVESENAVDLEVVKDVPIVRTINNQDVDAVRVRIAIPVLTQTNTSNGDLNGASVEYAIAIQSNGGGYINQILGDAWNPALVTKASTVSAQANSPVYRVQIGVLNPSEATTYDVQYKLIADSVWRTGGISRVVNVLNVTNYDAEGNPYNEAIPEAVYSTPTLDSGLWEMRVTNIVLAPDAEPPYINNVNANYGTPYDTVVGKTTSKYERSYRIKLTGEAPWDIKVIRNSPDSTSSALQDKTFWSSYTEIIDAKFRYPNSALIGVRVDASQFDAIPTRSYDLKLLKVKIPSNYNPVTRVYTGIWNGTFKVSWTDNPAWCFYDLVTNKRYGLGSFISESQIDKWTLYAIAKYCDELVPDGFGSTEPRYTCNLYLQNQEEAYTVINKMASVFRGMPYWASGSIATGYDAPADPVYQFTNSNVIDGDFNYIGSPKKSRYSVALVTWNDPDDYYRQKVEYVEDKDAISRYGIIQTEVIAVGCTSRGQANRVGRWILYTSQSETELVNFKTGLEGNAIRPSNIIQIADEARAGTRMGGRVVSATTTVINLDQSVNSIAGVVGSTFSVILPNGVLSSKTISSFSGSQITLSSALDLAPQANSIWMIQTSTLSSQLFRVISCSEEEDGIAISALAHDPSKYGFIENGLKLKPRDISNLSITPTPPTGINAVESLYTQGSSIKVLVTLSWIAVDGATEYAVSYRINNGNYIALPNTTGCSVDIRDTVNGNFTFKVQAINGIRKKSIPATYTKTIFGKIAPPSNVTVASYSIDKNVGVTLDWNDVSDVDLSSYEIRKGTSWDSATFLARMKSSTYVLGKTTDGTTTYLIKAIDTSGIYSTVAKSIAVTVAEAIAPTISFAFEGNQLALDWNDVSGSFATSLYEIRFGESWEAGTVLARNKVSYFRTTINWIGNRTFYIAAVDIAGNYGAIGSKVISTAALSNPTDFNFVFSDTILTSANIVLNWNPPDFVHGIKYYKLTYDSISLNINANTITLPANWQGTKTFTLKSVDLIGNASSGISISPVIYKPNPPTANTPLISQNQLYLKWFAPVRTTLPIWGYEVRKDTSFGTGSGYLYKGTGLQAPIPKEDTDYGLNTFYIKSIDTEGNYSTNYLTTTYTVNVPSPVTDLFATFNDTSLTNATVTLSWTATSAIFGVDYYELSYGTEEIRVKGTSVTIPANWTGSREFTIQVIDTLGQYSSGYVESFVKSVPNAPTAFATSVSQAVLNLSWTAPARTTLPIWGYEVRHDTNFGAPDFIFKGNTTNCNIPSIYTELGANSYYIKTIDTDNNYSTNYLTASYTLARPQNIVDFTTSFADSSLTSATITLDWADVSPTFGISGYLVTYNSSSYRVNASTITLPADWVGSRTYTIKTIDMLGNESTGYSETVTKLAPLPVSNFRAQVIDNNVLFYWDLPERTTLPISHVLLKKGATWATAIPIGTKSGGFTTIQETQGDTYTYWLATVDTDDIESTPVSLTTTVAEPPDFIFNGEFISSLSGTLSNAKLENGSVVMPINIAETWGNHFSTRSWADPQAQVTAGYPIYIQPTVTASYYEETFDFGTILASSKVTCNYAGTTVAGSPLVSLTLSVSVDNVTYTDYVGLSEVYATNFRYIKIRINVTQTSNLAVYKLNTLTVRLDAKQITDSNMRACLSTDTFGTIANFNKEFIDVTSINITPSGTTAANVVYDFQDANLTSTYAVVSNVCTITATAHGLITGQNVRLYFSSGSGISGIYTITGYTANTFTVAMVVGNTSGNCLTYPQGFRIYLFNSAGSRLSGTVSWTARGY